MIFLCVLFTVTISRAVDEYELFQEGYDLYLSCQPSKAVEKFEIFLKEFPDSSAKDSVLFWLGKALIQMGKLADSVKVFNEIKSNYPNSLFNYQARKEVEKISSLALKSEIDKPSDKAKINDRELVEVKSERDRLKLLAEEYKKKIENYENIIAELSVKERDLERIKNEKVRLEEKIKDIERSNQDTMEYLKKVKEEKDNLMAETEILRKRILNLEDVKKDLDTKDALLDKKQKEIEGLKAEIDLLTKKMAEKENIEIDLRKEIDANKKRIEDFNNKLIEMVKREKEAEIIIKEKESLIKKLASLEKEISRKAADLQAEKTKVVEDLERLKKEKDKVDSNLNERAEEIKLLKTKLLEFSKKEGELIKDRDDANAEALDLKKRLKVLEESVPDINKLMDDIDKLRSLLSEEKRKNDEANSRIAALEQKEKELLGLNATMKGVMESRLSEMGQRVQVCERDLLGLQKEKIEMENDSEELKRSLESLKTEVSRLRGLETEAKIALNRSHQYEAKIKELERVLEEGLKERTGLNMRLQRRDEEISRLLSEKRELEALLMKLKKKKEGSILRSIVIGNERFSSDYVVSYMFRSQLFLSRIGVRNVPWRRGDLNEDFFSEYILYEEAKNLNLEDKGDYEAFNRKFNLEKEEVEYLNRFNMISNLISHELKKLPSERSGEAVVVRYSDKDRYERALIVADMQNQMKSGIPVKDVIKLHPDAEYRTLSDKDINELFENVSGDFSDNEVVSTFNKERFMIVRIRINPLEYNPFEIPEEESNRRLREFISKMVSVGRTKKEISFHID